MTRETVRTIAERMGGGLTTKGRRIEEQPMTDDANDLGKWGVLVDRDADLQPQPRHRPDFLPPGWKVVK